jgi:hypothetical protein
VIDANAIIPLLGTLPLIYIVVGLGFAMGCRTSYILCRTNCILLILGWPHYLKNYSVN